MELKGKVLVITGAARGIGAEAARRFAGLGANVAAVDVREGEPWRLGEESEGAVLGVRADVSDAQGVESAFDAAVRRFGGVDVLINCAVVRGNGPLAEVEEGAIDLALAVGLKGGILCARRASREMRKRGGGAIVNMSSFYVRTAGEGARGLRCRKRRRGGPHARAGRRAGRRERARQRHRGGAGADQAQGGAGRGRPRELGGALRKSPMGRFGRVDEVLDAMMYLMTPRSSYMTGQVLVLDGGLTIA